MTKIRKKHLLLKINELDRALYRVPDPIRLVELERKVQDLTQQLANEKQYNLIIYNSLTNKLDALAKGSITLDNKEPESGIGVFDHLVNER